MYALVDCNNFYASCERAFNPKARGVPVVVLSNNDGCVIARSNEAKALGFEMGTPAFQVEEKMRQHGVMAFSSNYTLYGDMSNRVIGMLSSYVENIEIYSIDEAFLDLHGFERFGFKKYGTKILNETMRGTGIPLSMGIAPTKTLAKVANKFAKKYRGYKGVCVIDTEEKRVKALRNTEIGDIWGIGRRYARRLKAMGINTAYDFSQLPAAWVRKEMTVVGERMWKELNGTPCIELELAPPPKKQICASRAFGRMLTDQREIADAVTTYASLCAQKLREQNTCAASLMVFIHTNNFIKFDPQYHKNIVMQLPVPTNSTLEICKHALQGLRLIFADGYRYKKAGVIITEIVGADAVQANMFDTVDREKHRRIMEVMDKLNSGFNTNVLTLGTQTRERTWKLRRERLSPNFTTDIDQLLEVKAG